VKDTVFWDVMPTDVSQEPAAIAFGTLEYDSRRSFLERLYTTSRLHGVTCQKATIFIVFAKTASTVTKNRVLNRRIPGVAREEVTGQAAQFAFFPKRYYNY
jgi:hypothetical protein